MTLPVLLFDLDGTLVDSAPAIAEALSQLRLERGGTAIDAATVRPLVSQGVEVLVATALGTCARDLAGDVSAFRAVLRTIPSDRTEIFPSVHEALAELGAAGYAMAVVTNKPEGLSRTLLNDLGLASHFAAVVGGDTLPTRKPDPAPLIQAVRDAAPGVKAGAAMIGDSPVDQSAARAAGLPFLLFGQGYDAAACTPDWLFARFDSFADLPGLSRSLPAQDQACGLC